MELTKMQILEQALREKAPLRLPDILREEIDEFRASEQYAVMAEAEQYYRNRSSVQQKRQTLAKRSNTRMEHPILRKLVMQKVNYLLAKPFTVQAENNAYTQALNEVDRMRKESALRAGLAGKAHDPDDVLALLDIGKIELSEDGKLREPVDSLIRDIRAKKPYLFAEEAAKPALHGSKPAETPAGTPGGSDELSLWRAEAGLAPEK